MTRKSQKRFEVVHPNSAAVDVGGSEHLAAVDPTKCDEPVKRFSAFTDDLIAMAEWFSSMDVKVVAMEATGVYWIPLFEILDARGFEVYLVNSKATRQITGRKSDVLDCQWILQLMTHGLLRGAFRPADDVCSLRSLVRQRGNKVRDQAKALNRMQKALVQMNIQLAQVLSNIAGVTGMSILRAIAGGERDPEVLAMLRDKRVKADHATVARSLHGNWRAEHLHALARNWRLMIFWRSRLENAIKPSPLPLNGYRYCRNRSRRPTSPCETRTARMSSNRFCIKR